MYVHSPDISWYRTATFTRGAWKAIHERLLLCDEKSFDDSDIWNFDLYMRHFPRIFERGCFVRRRVGAA